MSSYIFNHVFLPPKLPQLNDTTPEVEVGLTELFHNTLSLFLDDLPEEEQGNWMRLPAMLNILLNNNNIESPFRNLDEKLGNMREGDVLALHITHQNAGLVLRRQLQTYSIEIFELSATSQAVTGTTGRLVHRFPGPVIVVPEARVDHNFRKAFTQCFTSLESETPKDAIGKGCGAHRDTIHPRFATEWLPGILRGIGSPLDVSRVYKRTRDDVLWGDGLEPWRRSPRWTLLKVALQTSIVNRIGDHTRYKIFMVYFMATILEKAVDHKCSSDILHVMLAKLSRRIRKLDITSPGNNPIWAQRSQEFVTESMESARNLIAKRWNIIQKAADSAGTFHVAELEKLKPQSDTILHLANLRPYLKQVHNIEIKRYNKSTFDEKCSRRINGKRNSLPEPESAEPKSPFEVSLSLLDLEVWVSKSLDTWLDRNIKSESRFVKLSNVIIWYISTSPTVYAGSAEGFSVMILTMMLLWVALDKATIFHYPLLKNFDPGFPTTLFDALLLPKRNQMIHLRDIEQYLLKRKTNSDRDNPSIFTDVTSSSSFGAQYFEQSFDHQKLKRSIEREAKDESKAKKDELKEKKKEFSKLTQRSELLSCTTIMHRSRRNPVSQEVHDPNCTKCDLRRQAQSLRITCYEWPLPESEPAAKSVVFELDIPSLICSWRSTTYRILADILNPSPLPLVKPKNVSLTEYPGLKNYLKSKADRLQLASSTKPFAQTQYASRAVSDATENDVCVPNNLNFAMQDLKSQRSTRERLNKSDIHERCTLRLPKGCYHSLQYAVASTKHTSNEVLSKHAICPDGLTVHEVRAFAALRSGHRLQWLNIARELVSQTLDLKKEEVYLLLLQASCQAGPSALQQVSRDSHIELEEESFGQNLLSAMEAALASVGSNWQGSVAALTLISLTIRLLSVSLHESVRNRCLRFLQKARNITIGWLRMVVEILHESSSEEEMLYLTLRALDLALICHSTFDVDPRQLLALLSTTENVSIVIETATTIKERCPVSQEILSTLTRELLHRFSRTAHTVESVLRERIVASSDGINKAVKRLWPGYEPGTPWAVVEAPEDRWLTTRTSNSDNVSPMTLHYNLLTGSLLIASRPLNRLLPEYESHSMYKRLFGSKILEVVPSSKGLHFETRNSVHGFQVHFALHDKDLIVRASKDRELYEVIPTHALEKDFPRTLVQNYVHWIHLGSMVIEWRPLHSKWLPSTENWRISAPEDASSSRLALKSRCLVEPGSPTAVVIQRWLKPLENPPNINIYYNDEIEETEVCLPRMNLDFILRDTELESKQFRGMIVDTNQYIGTLHGLQHKLVLRDIQGPSRITIVPHGTVSYHRRKHHVQVSIYTGLSDKIPYHQFVIDKDLGLLIDNGNLRSRLFKLYLHALTSHCLPDPLTSRTGSEEALHGLRLASTRSFLSLDPEHVELLRCFAKLTPSRTFYPKGSKFMQTVNWEDLSPLSHHEGFVTEAHSMLLQAESFQVFQPSLDTKYKIERGPRELRQRAAIRSACYRVHPFGAECFDASYDATYNSTRDAIPNSSREREACYIATMVDKWSCRLDPYNDLFHQIQMWGSFFHGPQSDFRLDFSKRWMETPSSFMPQYWCSIQSLLSKSDATRDKLQITIFLANLASSRHDNAPLIHTLLALATAPALRHIQPPPYAHFDFSRGFEPEKSKVSAIIEGCKVSFENSPESRIDRLPEESDFYFLDRRQAAYQAATKLQVSKCLNALMRQWPSKDVIPPRTLDTETYLPLLSNSMGNIRSLFETCHKNFEFRQYIEDVQIVLDSLPQPLQQPEYYSIPPQEDTYKNVRAYLMIDDLLQNPAPDLPLSQDELEEQFVTMRDQPAVESGSSKLKSLLNKLSKSANGHYQRMYVKDLQKSHNAFLANTSAKPQLMSGVPYSELTTPLDQCKKIVETLYRKVCSKLVVSGTQIDNARQAMLPRLSPSVLLQLLARFEPVSAEWKLALTRYALAITSMQRAERLVACSESDSDIDILNELTNSGHTNWDPMDLPEWLLLELESNILIRPEQGNIQIAVLEFTNQLADADLKTIAQIAREMIAPQSGSNSIMQLNMGLGKSSIIVPIVAATLADRKKLSRVIVLSTSEFTSSRPQFEQLTLETFSKAIGSYA
ncbi:uncharacterized protein LY89DRAFT_716588 [Mollisia scopiformis]|uniref:ubiquitinyl hydrolase 1 n=1 Tax=Mollisia scopiformis TaxID=149040 RepID=A0A194XK36_MOLSC|nr:uncharacterized protein LY89DRAFT_716588 [Mollisia scopiformis]KUJ20152.1 hypothetical protein LY89DRAFT_716588 [Mollisia scopiformis]